MFPIEWSYMEIVCLKTLTPEQNGCHFGHDTFKCLLLNETINFHRRVQLTINQHWLGLWLDPQQATRPTMNKWWHSSLTHIWVNESDDILKLHRRYKLSNDCLNGLCISVPKLSSLSYKNIAKYWYVKYDISWISHYKIKCETDAF